MVDIDQDGIKAPVRLCGVKADILSGAGEEIAADELASWIGTQNFSKRQQARHMPVDDRLKCLNNPQTANGFVTQHRLGGVAKSETANHEVQLTPVVILLRVIGKAKRAKGNF